MFILKRLFGQRRWTCSVNAKYNKTCEVRQTGEQMGGGSQVIGMARYEVPAGQEGEAGSEVSRELVYDR